MSLKFLLRFASAELIASEDVPEEGENRGVDTIKENRECELSAIICGIFKLTAETCNHIAIHFLLQCVFLFIGKRILFNYYYYNKM